KTSDMPHAYRHGASRFSTGTTAPTPQRACPAHWMFLAAFSSRSRMSPQLGQMWVWTESDFSTRVPHPLQSCRGERGRHGDDSTASVHCCAFEEGRERRPARISDALSEVVIAHHAGNPQVFKIHRVVGAQRMQRGLVMEVAPLPTHFLMLAGEHARGFV